MYCHKRRFNFTTNFTKTETDAKEIDTILEDATLLLACIKESRYSIPFIHHSVPKVFTFTNEVLQNLDEGRFKKYMRCSRSQFNKILCLIENDSAFDGARSGKQLPIELQLIVTLYRLGSYGEGATICKMAGLFGIGDGGTIQVVVFS